MPICAHSFSQSVDDYTLTMGIPLYNIYIHLNIFRCILDVVHIDDSSIYIFKIY
ncbi:hypothetical protein AHEV_008 [Adoxophyes honmai entomopoxvirus 'L']|uniref:Uncharacterized protein n=1 Tax=Adoxophyes honmai entomopoxvirus 'L' TaxID=1293540 RepID=A0A916KNU8_9POXV|nr:hypothetical protein AHEV_008 [Adoxophyes honmai entomopoxvirus 'L']CCU55329.1 hypothetical protein AHEV_008 [Adoxophyes honmai entomopoxvirus 'L']